MRIGGSAKDVGFRKIFVSRESTPVPQRGRRIYGLPFLPPTPDFVFVRHCVCVFRVVRLWDCGVVRLWVCSLAFCGLVALCVLVCLCLFARRIFSCVIVCDCMFVDLWVC